VLRQPLEDRIVTISRAQGTTSFPANFVLVAAMNPCPCGFYGDTTRACTCAPSAVARYQRRISGPLLDRIDIHLEVPRVAYDKLAAMQPGESTRAVAERVEQARKVQRARLAGAKASSNGEMTPVDVRRFCQACLDDGSRSLLKLAMEQLNLSARAFHRTLKLARTIADLAGSERIETAHVAEAVQYRRRGS
jgi:magnesium chelatase family protein